VPVAKNMTEYLSARLITTMPTRVAPPASRRRVVAIREVTATKSMVIRAVRAWAQEDQPQEYRYLPRSWPSKGRRIGTVVTARIDRRVSPGIIRSTSVTGSKPRAPRSLPLEIGLRGPRIRNHLRFIAGPAMTGHCLTRDVSRSWR